MVTKGHTHLNKPAAKSCILLPPGIKGLKVLKKQNLANQGNQLRFFQKQSPRGEVVLGNFAKFTEKHLWVLLNF